jgi:hypothetical protein
MDLDKIYGFDEQKATRGVWFDLVDGGKVLLGMLGSSLYQQAVMKHSRKYQTKIRLNKMSPEDMNEITIQSEADAVLLGWHEFEVNGQPFLYTRDNAVTLLRKFPRLKAEIEEYANDHERFQASMVLEEDAKN